MLSGSKSFAIFLRNFTDSANPTPFTIADVRRAWHVIDTYWGYNSFGILSVGSSTVYDWQTFNMTTAQYTAKFTSTNASGNLVIDRRGMVEYVKTQSGIDTTKFDGFVVIFSNAVGDAFSSGNDAIFEPTIVSAALMCHEMQHMFGEPDHAFDYTNRQIVSWAQPGEYWDQTDVMSAANCWSTAAVAGNPFSGTGPNLNMMWRDQWGWLLAPYVRRISDAEIDAPFDQAFTLGARNFNTGQGLMCVQFSDIYVELAIGGGGQEYDFDAGLTGAGILIHQRVVRTIGGGTHTVPIVLVKNLAGRPDDKFWNVGDICVRDGSGSIAGAEIYVWVQQVDAASGTANINISNTWPPPLTSNRIEAIRKAHSTAGGHGGFDYIDYVGVRDSTGTLRAIPRTWVADWIDRGRNSFFVIGADGSRANVIVEQHWIKTVADGDIQDNLLSLPLF